MQLTCIVCKKNGLEKTVLAANFVVRKSSVRPYAYNLAEVFRKSGELYIQYKFVGFFSKGQPIHQVDKRWQGRDKIDCRAGHPYYYGYYGLLVTHSQLRPSLVPKKLRQTLIHIFIFNMKTITC